MKDTWTNRIHELAKIRNRSSSNEEFWLKAAAEGALPGFCTTAMFRLFLFRNRHPGLKWLEIGAFGLVIVGFSLLFSLVGLENPLGAVGILLLALAVLVPLELLVWWFEDLQRSMVGRRQR